MSMVVHSGVPCSQFFRNLSNGQMRHVARKRNAIDAVHAGCDFELINMMLNGTKVCIDGRLLYIVAAPLRISLFTQ